MPLQQCAIQQSRELALLQERLALLQRRLRSQQVNGWTAWLTTDPVELAANVLGGGRVGQRQVAAAELEYKQAELDVLVETKAQALREQVANTVLEVERVGRAIALTQKQLAAEQQRLAMARIGYRLGEGSRDGFLAQQLRVEALEARVVELEAEQEQLRGRLGLLCLEG